MNSLLEQIYNREIVLDANNQELKALKSGIPRYLAEALYRIIRENKMHRTLEIGMAFGLSTLAICQALQDNGGGHHFAIDPWQRTAFRSVGLLNIEKCKFDNLLTFYEYPSHFVLPELLRQDKQFDLIFIDGSHLFDFVILDFFYAQRLVPIGGVICMDDTTHIKAVATAFGFITSNLNHLEIIEVTQRYSILKKIAEDRRPWDHFQPFV